MATTQYYVCLCVCEREREGERDITDLNAKPKGFKLPEKEHLIEYFQFEILVR